MENRIYSTREAGLLVGRSWSQLARWCKKNKIKRTELGRFVIDEALLSYLKDYFNGPNKPKPGPRAGSRRKGEEAKHE